ncbi:prolyl 4-hydroxylase subunit alpha-1 [Galendromus occidentalis]|uniref:procollagen-proline 4-dioxygenase n=1 Tax=Galendromus occidentalis TaxID=34638 RepID=A0AAJ6VZ82_9ACAR|nr:prolyl 4-hydroxylase subunit alpha-1 [Galendromus occidentalis]
MRWSILAAVCTVCAAEFFTATVNLEKLLVTERETVSALEQYIQAENARLERVKHLKNDLEGLWKMAERDSGFVMNPVNAFLLVKKLSADFNVVKSMIFHPKSSDVIRNLTDEVRFPDDEDLDGAAVALLRLQDVYALDTSQMANGVIAPGANESPRLLADDCFELGRQSYVKEDFYHTVLWMQEALERLNTTQYNPAEVEVDILEYLAFATFRLGNLRHALKLTDDLLSKRPDHPRASGNKRYYLSELGKNQSGEGRGDTKEAPVETHIKRQDSLSDERIMYERLCRGEPVEKPFLRKNLHCTYFHNNHPYMILQPSKLEVIHERPYLALFHDIMSDDEIQTVIELSAPRLKRATVQNAKSGELEVANYRISKSAWLKNHDHEVVERLSFRFEYLTGLTHLTAEELQVVNYGIGGHYEAHFDFARRDEKDAFKQLGTGNRIATWINYMSDVKAGGATVFPRLGLTVWPEKGSAAFWWNLHRSGEGDILTRHAACPVLAGSKWVSNKWFHERGQEFRRKCGLKQTD